MRQESGNRAEYSLKDALSFTAFCYGQEATKKQCAFYQTSFRLVSFPTRLPLYSTRIKRTHIIVESLRLDKTFKIIWSNPTTDTTH